MDAAGWDGGRDLPAEMIKLAHTDLLLLEPDPAADPDAAWLVSWVQGTPCLVVATSADQLPAGYPSRPVRAAALAAVWPSAQWSLLVDPGTPGQLMLDHEAVLQVAALAAEPASLVEESLARAAAGGDVEAYVGVLATQEVVLPAPPWVRIPDPEGGPDEVIVVFTSWDRWRELGGQDAEGIALPFPALVDAWPDHGDGTAEAMVVDPGAVHSVVFPSATMAALREHVRRVVADLDDARPGSDADLDDAGLDAGQP